MTTTSTCPEIDEDKAPDVLRLVQRLGALPKALLGELIEHIGDKGIEASIKHLLEGRKSKALAYLAEDAQARCDEWYSENDGHDPRVVVIVDGHSAFHPTPDIGKACREAAEQHTVLWRKDRRMGSVFISAVTSPKDEVSP